MAAPRSSDSRSARRAAFWGVSSRSPGDGRSPEASRRTPSAAIPAAKPPATRPSCKSLDDGALGIGLDTCVTALRSIKGIGHFGALFRQYRCPALKGIGSISKYRKSSVGSRVLPSISMLFWSPVPELVSRPSRTLAMSFTTHAAGEIRSSGSRWPRRWTPVSVFNLCFSVRRVSFARHGQGLIAIASAGVWRDVPLEVGRRTQGGSIMVLGRSAYGVPSAYDAGSPSPVVRQELLRLR